MRIKPVKSNLKKKNLSKATLAGSTMHNALNGSGSKLDSYFQRAVYSDENLIISLQNTLILHDHDIRQNATLLGKFIGLFLSAKNPDWITIDGTRLIQLHQLANAEPSGTLSASSQYFVEVSQLRTMLNSAISAKTGC